MRSTLKMLQKSTHAHGVNNIILERSQTTTNLLFLWTFVWRFRFLGTTSKSSSIRQLLNSVLQQIKTVYHLDAKVPKVCSYSPSAMIAQSLSHNSSISSPFSFFPPSPSSSFALLCKFSLCLYWPLLSSPLLSSLFFLFIIFFHRFIFNVLCMIIIQKSFYYFIKRTKALIEALPLFLTSATEHKPLIILFDSLDQLSPNGGGRQLSWLPTALPKHVKFVVSTLPDAEFRCYPKLRASIC